MDLIYLHQYFNTPVMTGGTRSYEMGRRLVAAGHRVHLITSDRRADAPRDGRWRVTVEAGIEVHWLGVPYAQQMSHARRSQAFLHFALAASRRAAAIPADIVFATSTPLTIALPAIHAARRQRIPLVLEVRDVWPEVPIAVGVVKGPLIPLTRWLERYAYRHATAIVALSPDMRASIARRTAPDKPIHVIPNSADTELFNVPAGTGHGFRRQHAWLADRPLILYAGTVGLVNGIDYFARVAAALARIEPTICCLVVGQGREEDAVRTLAAELGVLERNFFMLPPVSKVALPPILAAAQIATSFVIDVPELWANSANKVFDAFAAGRPLAINHEGWQADLLRRTGAGLVLPAADPARAAQMLAAALKDPAWLSGAGAAAAALAQDRFGRDQLAASLEDVLVRVASEVAR